MCIGFTSFSQALCQNFWLPLHPHLLEERYTECCRLCQDEGFVELCCVFRNQPAVLLWFGDVYYLRSCVLKLKENHF